MIENLKDFNVFGTVTVRQSRVSILAVSVFPNRRSIERTNHLEIEPIPELGTGAHQLLFGAKLTPGRHSEIVVYQIRGRVDNAPNLFDHPDIQKALYDTVDKIRKALAQPHQPPTG